jgi:nitrogen regulatory protein PII
MSKMVFLVTSRVDKGLAVAEAWEAAGAPGVTLIESHGLHRLQQQSRLLEIPLFVSMASLLRQIEDTNQTIFSVVEDNLVDTLIEAAYKVLGTKDLTEEDMGIAFVIDVERVIGMRRWGESKDHAE